jgi:hypothetical protein
MTSTTSFSKLPSPLLSMLIETFIDSLRWSNRSISTVLSYRHDLISLAANKIWKSDN